MIKASVKVRFGILNIEYSVRLEAKLGYLESLSISLEKCLLRNGLTVSADEVVVEINIKIHNLLGIRNGVINIIVILVECMLRKTRPFSFMTLS